MAHISMVMIAAAVLVFGAPIARAQDQWRHLSPTTAPSERCCYAMAYDAGRGVAVLFGGNTDSLGANNETWEWSGQGLPNWTQRTVSGPSARINSAMAFDESRGVCVLFGGLLGGARKKQRDLGMEWQCLGAPDCQRSIGPRSPCHGV